MSADPPPGPPSWSRYFKLCGVVPAGLALGFGIRELVGTVGLLGLLLALVIAFFVRQEMSWRKPRRTLLRVLVDVAEGAGPIAALDEVNGELKSLVPVIRRLLSEARHKHFEVRKLEAELPERVAKRTDALERTIGRFRAQAEHDALTTLLNRRCFDRDLPATLAQCRRDGKDMAVMLIDLDHFKQVNDQLGHSAGDRLLREIAQLIKSGIGENGAAYRLGGDEFCVLLPGSTEAAATALVVQLKEMCAALVRPLKLTPAPGLSCGIATRMGCGDAECSTLLETADRRLYGEKSLRPSLRRVA